MSGVQTALLWSDLLLWARRYHGDAWAARTARLMSAAVTARLLARALVRPLVPDRARWDRDSAALRSARETLSPS